MDKGFFLQDSWQQSDRELAFLKLSLWQNILFEA